MQSLSRQIRRGNAHIVFNNVTKSMEIVQKRGTSKTKWDYSVKNKMSLSEDQFCEQSFKINPKNKRKVEEMQKKKRYYEKKLLG